MFYYAPETYYAVNASLRGEMPVKLRKVMSMQGGRDGKSLRDRKFTIRISERGLSLREGGSGEHPAILVLVLKKQYQEATVTVLAVSEVVAVLVVTATPLKSNPPFPPSCY